MAVAGAISGVISGFVFGFFLTSGGDPIETIAFFSPSVLFGISIVVANLAHLTLWPLKLLISVLLNMGAFIIAYQSLAMVNSMPDELAWIGYGFGGLVGAAVVIAGILYLFALVARMKVFLLALVAGFIGGCAIYLCLVVQGALFYDNDASIHYLLIPGFVVWQAAVGAAIGVGIPNDRIA